jgi:DNA-directed RNA polymerase alpha subunit
MVTDSAIVVEFASGYSQVFELDGRWSKKCPVSLQKTGIPYSIPLEELDLSTRAYNGLKQAKLSTFGDVTKLTIQKMKGMRNVGKRTIVEIENLLISQGFELRCR